MARIKSEIEMEESNRKMRYNLELEVPDAKSPEEFKEYIKSANEGIQEKLQLIYKRHLFGETVDVPVVELLPAPRRASTPSVQNSDAPSPKQIKAIKGICKANGIDEFQVAREHGVSNVEDMNRRDVWGFIDKHTKKINP